MPDQPKAPDVKPAGEAPATPAATPPVPPRRSPGHRGADVRDTVAEMAAKAQEISQEAGSKMAAAMKDVINAAAGIAGFAVESARDLVQYMVRRGQMTQEEADKLIREAEAAQVGRPPVAPRAAAKTAPAPDAEPVRAAAPAAPVRPAMPAAPASPAPVARPSAPPAAPPARPSTPAAKVASPPAAKKAAAPAKPAAAAGKAAAKKAPAVTKAPATPAAKAAPAKKAAAKGGKKR